VPILARSVGFLPVFFPPEGGLGHGPIEALPLPVDADQLVVLVQGVLPERAEHPPLLPPLEVPVEAAAGPELGRNGLPVAAGPQDVEDAVEHLAVWQAGAAALGGRTDPGEQWLDPFPQGVGDTERLNDGVAGGGHDDPPATGESVGTSIITPGFWDRLLDAPHDRREHSPPGTQ
jgi:hypothetical protein